MCASEDYDEQRAINTKPTSENNRRIVENGVNACQLLKKFNNHSYRCSQQILRREEVRKVVP